MNISEEELLKEVKYLKHTTTEIRNQISALAENLYDNEEKQKEFKAFLWDSRQELDPTEMKVLRSQSDMEIRLLEKKAAYFRKLYKIQDNPYFGKITFQEEGHNKKLDYYIGLTYLTKDNDNIINDWRSPISSIFYDFENGDISFETPGGIVNGVLHNKRQFTIEGASIKRVFDNNLNVQDELLQEVLSNKANDKMKNIVNTIQAEQNRIIRNTKDNNLIVQGIAGSGKTSVALHRVAFLLYKIKNLTSDKVLIFAPNNIFSEYISNVLPELGEENTKETTFHKFLYSYITEYKYIEDFTSFIERYYKHNEIDTSLVKIKQSDEIVKPMIDYVKRITNDASFKDDIMTRDLFMTKEELNYMFKKRYSKFPLFQRFDATAEKICEQKFTNRAKLKTISKLVRENLTCELDFKKLYKDFFFSKEFKSVFDKEINEFYIKRLDNDTISYEDAILFVFMKCLLCGFVYDYEIEQTIVDEAQDYNKLQYILMKRILRKSKFTILGDINQTINPYYQYKSLDEISGLFKGDYNYIELTKTYRSSPEIIEHTNKILNLTLASAIRRDNHIPVEFRKEDNLKDQLVNDIKSLIYDNRSIAVITKTDDEASKVFNLLKKDIPDIKLISNKSNIFSRGLVVIPSYISKGLEFDATIVYTEKDNPYIYEERYLYYVACTRSQHHLIIYNQKKL